ncbi:MAG: ABC transporter ATP-binding protein [Actinomycetota bacterium]
MLTDVSAARCENLVKTYSQASGQVLALRDVTADFPAGALTAVVGPSGSGKSSLLRLLAAMDRPTSGWVSIGEVMVHSASTKELRHLRRSTVGYVLQRPSDNFISYLTLGEHLDLAAIGAEPSGVDNVELLAELGIEHRVNHRPHELSGGEQQRGAFAQILAAGPRIIVADEPTAELDSSSAHVVVEMVRRLVERGVTVVIATHDANVSEVADKIIELDHGILKPADGDGSRRPPARPRSVPARHPERTELGARRRWSRAGWQGSPLSSPPPARRQVAEIQEVTKSYRRGDEVVHALKDVSFDLNTGEVVGLVGRSGSGKTTLLNVIAGWEEPDGGRVRWSNGVEMESLLSWSDVSVLPQKLGLLDELSVRSNIEYPARLVGKVKDTRGFVDELLDDLGLTDLQSRFPKETSVGEQQRTALARALVMTPRLLLADEPAGHQDRGFSNRVFEALRKAAGRGTCCLVATHNEELAGYLDRIVPMTSGRADELADSRRRDDA